MVNEIVLEEDEVLDIRYDRLFHDLINEKEMDTVEWIVMKILKCKYEDIHGKVKVGNIRLPNLSKDDKEKYVDLIVYYKDDIIGIELNNNATGDYLRNALYMCNAINNSYIVGGDYNKITQGILVNLNWFTDSNLKKYKEAITETIWSYPSLDKNKSEYFIKFINVNLLYFQNMCYTSTKKEDIIWKLFTIKKKSELDDIVNKENLLLNYRNKLHRLSKSKEYCKMIWDERIENNLRDREAFILGKDDGIKEGIEQNRTEIIINMYRDNLDLDIIAKYANVTVDIVKDIISKLSE